MARLIEFFTLPGELVLDPFAGVGGTLLGAAICRQPRLALGFELEQRWADVYANVIREALGERDGLGPVLADLGSADPGGPRSFDPAGSRMVVGNSAVLLETWPKNRSTSSRPTRPTTPSSSSPWPAASWPRRSPTGAPTTRWSPRATRATSRTALVRRVSGADGLDVWRVCGASCVPADTRVIVRDAYQDGPLPVHRLGPRHRAESVGFVTKGDIIWYAGRHPPPAIRLSALVRAEHRPPAHRRVEEVTAGQVPSERGPAAGRAARAGSRHRSRSRQAPCEPSRIAWSAAALTVAAANSG